MKNFFISFMLLAATIVSANAQNYKPFKFGLGIGYAAPSNGGGGILLDLEPAYRLNDVIAVGLRVESAAMARAIGESEGSISGNGSYTINGQYYLSSAKVRPYVGLGLGIFTIASVSVSEDSGDIGGGSKFGLYPRIGLDMGHFNLNVDYNIIPSTELDGYSSGSGETSIDVQNSYIGFRIGAFIFGGQK